MDSCGDAGYIKSKLILRHERDGQNPVDQCNDG